MPEINWGMINSGDAFESLMHALVFAEDPTAILFKRPGKDSGQDARSLDGTHVYQAKYRAGLKMADAVTLALDELENIKKYKTPTHQNYKHWQNAKQWTLVANIAINSDDWVRWKRVIEAFQREGFQDVTYWGIEQLENKLILHPEIRDAFFKGVNRTLLGLREAHDWLGLTSPGKDFIDVEYVGHNDLFERVKSFFAGSKRILTVVGDHCAGVSRFLYEVMNTLSNMEKRVYWGLAKEMAGTNDWFKYIRSSKETYVIIDDVDSHDFVKRLIGQMASAECSNWKVIIASHTENRQSLQPISVIDKEFTDEIPLSPLTKNEISILAGKCVPSKKNLPTADVLYTLTQGLPGWLALLLEASVDHNTPQLTITDNLSDIVLKVRDECLKHIPEGQRDAALKILCWIGVWGVLQVNEQSLEMPEIDFLRREMGQGLDVLALLQSLVNSGIIHNWGVNKRCFAVEPSIVRQEILRNWLLRKNGSSFVLNSEGNSLVKKMIQGAIPKVDTILQSLSNIAISYMGRHQAEASLNPVFDVLVEESRNGNILNQLSIIQLLRNVGWAHPDRALEVLAAIRANPKESQIVHNDLYGDVSIDSDDILSDIVEDIFQYGSCVSSMVVAKRYLNEIKELINLETYDGRKIDIVGTCESKLLKLLNSEAEQHYLVCETVSNVDIKELSSSRFTKAIVRALLNPEREEDVWARYSLTISWKVIHPQSYRWECMLKLRKKLFTHLLNEDCEEDRILLWNLLSESHHAFFHAIFSTKGIPEDLLKDYRKLLKRDLLYVLCVSRKHGQFSLSEFTAAREMWSWYLQYGQSEDPIALANRCEKIKYEGSDWELQNFFAFIPSSDAAPAITRVEQKLKSYSTIGEWKEFFNQAKQYLRFARGGRNDMADGMRIADLALRFSDKFNPIDEGGVVKDFVKSTLSETCEDSLDIQFAIQLCKLSIKAAKRSDNRNLLKIYIQEMLKWTCNPARFLWYIYIDSHPMSIGELSEFELDIVNEHLTGLSLNEAVALQAKFVGIGQDKVLANMEKVLKSIDKVQSASLCMACFLSSLLTSFIRYGYDSKLIPISWIFTQINILNLDGALLGMSDAEELAKRSFDRQNMAIALNFFERRYELTKNKPYAEFQVLPHEFNAAYWFYIDEQADFDKLCLFAVQHYGFLSIYELPKILSKIDTAAIHLSRFIATYLPEHHSLTSDEFYVLACLVAECKPETDGWRDYVSTICRYCENLSQKERYYIYAGFQPKIMTSWRQIGAVSQDLVDAVGNAQVLFDKEKDNQLKEYRQWVLQCVKNELEKVKDSVEEELHNGA